MLMNVSTPFNRLRFTVNEFVLSYESRESNVVSFCSFTG